MKKRQNSSIPDEVEFTAASRFMAARIRGEERLKAGIVFVCASCSKYHDVFVWLLDGRCHVDLFFQHDDDLGSLEAKRVRDAVLEQLESALEKSIILSVELDSHERVVREFNGSYYKRFR